MERAREDPMRSATRTRLGLGLVAAAAFMLASVTPVAAAAPQVVGERHFEVVRDIAGFINCGDYVLDYHVEVFRTITEFYDNDGNLVRAHFDIHYKGTVTNAETGMVARDDGSRMFIDDYVAQTSTLVRGSHHVTVPGYGIVFGETGRAVSDWNGTTPDESEEDDFVIFSAGLHGDPVDICDAMR
jgi:hypothetical protein